uniref:Uncharacterized protein n=1 Tax=Romanomermis culicivorax TaxID=13658 RepID=A0A915J8R3_ROMCU
MIDLSLYLPQKCFTMSMMPDSKRVMLMSSKRRQLGFIRKHADQRSSLKSTRFGINSNVNSLGCEVIFPSRGQYGHHLPAIAVKPLGFVVSGNLIFIYLRQYYGFKEGLLGTVERPKKCVDSEIRLEINADCILYILYKMDVL